jgi:uncharacterized membrane protein YkoI
MRRKDGYMRTITCSLIASFMVLAAACAGNEEGKSYWLRHAVVTLSQAAEIAERNGQGRAVGVELGQSGNHVYYDVEIIDAVNKSRHLRVDAETGKIVRGL